MDHLKIKLSELERPRLRKSRDLAIRARIYREMWRLEAEAILARPLHGLYKPVAIALLVCLAVSSIVPGYAYASSRVNADSQLYPLKLAVEAVELKLAASPNAKSEKLEKFSSRRLDEAVVLSNKEESKNIESTIAAAVSLKKQAIPLAREKFEGSINDSQASQVDNLEMIAQNVGVNAPDPVIDRIALALEVFKGPAKREMALPDDSHATGSRDRETERRSGDTSRKNIAAPTEPSVSPSTRQDMDDNKLRSLRATATETIRKVPDLEVDTNGNIAASGTKSRETIERVRRKVEMTKLELRSGAFPADQANTMVEKLEKKLKQAEELKGTEDEQASALESTEALSDHARSFIRTDKDKNRDRGSDNENRSGDNNEKNNRSKGKDK